MLSAPSLWKQRVLTGEGLSRLSRPEPASRSGFSLAHNDRLRPAITGSLFPTCLFNASLDCAQVRSTRNSSLAPGCPSVGDLNAACPLP
jgi:hypothetical protein